MVLALDNCDLPDTNPSEHRKETFGLDVMKGRRYRRMDYAEKVEDHPHHVPGERN